MTLSFCLLDARSGLSAEERHGVVTEFATQFVADCPMMKTLLAVFFGSQLAEGAWLQGMIKFFVWIYISDLYSYLFAECPVNQVQKIK